MSAFSQAIKKTKVGRIDRDNVQKRKLGNANVNRWRRRTQLHITYRRSDANQHKQHRHQVSEEHIHPGSESVHLRMLNFKTRLTLLLVVEEVNAIDR